MKNVFAKGSFIILTLLFAAAFGLFAAWRMKQPRPADADLAALGDALQASGLLQSSKPGSARECRKSFGLSSDSYEEILYFSPMTFMDVEEVLVVRAPEGAEAAAEAMRTRLSELQKSFENYGTFQSAMLKETQIYENGVYACYAAGEHSREIMMLIREEIEE